MVWHYHDTLSVALKRAGFTFKRNRYSLKKRNEEEFVVKKATLAKTPAVGMG
ncbi:hypothetical protein [Burkholderia territorii]|uniref:hypothetical protein n=1 Tax=Burkholderia territorii TaxID=1503055 RepID=UPI000A72FC6B|nr:hypothetical protein [Burkholderia territorii]